MKAKTPALLKIKQHPSKLQAAAEILGQPFCILEIETTGYAPGYHHIISISIGLYEKGKLKKKYKTLVNPLKNISYAVSLITGLSNETLAEAPTFEEIADEISSLLKGKIIVSYNTAATLSFIAVEFKRLDRRFVPDAACSAIDLVKKFFPESKNYSFKTACLLLGVKETIPGHQPKQPESTSAVFSALLNKLMIETKVRTFLELTEFLKSTSGTTQRKKKESVLVKELQNIPNKPGVYFFEGAYGKLLYIGKAKSLKSRLRSYLSISAGRKSRKLADNAKTIRIHETNSELTALLTEAELIKTLHPKHNVMLRDYGNKYFIRLRSDTPFPAPELTNRFSFDSNDYYGLFISRRKATEIKDLIDRAFLLRECTDKELALGKGCFLAEINRCLAPCYAQDTTAYQEELHKIEDFFAGKNSFILQRLLGKMKDLSSQLKFEQAAEIKIAVDLIIGQVSKASLLSEPINRASVVLEIEGPAERDFILLLRGKVYIHNYLPDTENKFDQGLTDYFAGSKNIQEPNDEDLEKIRIILNWVVKNNKKVRIYYLKDFKSQYELERKISAKKKAAAPMILNLTSILNSM